MGGFAGQRHTTILRQTRTPATACLTLGAALLAACSGGGANVDQPGAAPVAAAAQGSPAPPNQPPLVNAGESQAAQGGGIVVLSGSAVDPDGGSLAHTWRQVDGPGVVLNDADSPVASFETPAHLPTTSLSFELVVTDADGLSSVDSMDVIVTTGYSPCAVTSPPAGLPVDTWFYQKYCDANGQPVLAPAVVSDRAVEWIRYQALEMLKRLPVTAQAMIRNGSRIAIKGHEHVLTQIPEYSDLSALYPEYDWDLLPGVGAVMDRPVTSTSEENVLCLDDDAYRGYSVFIHEFAHSIHLIGLTAVDSTFDARLRLAYDTAIASGLWAETYAASSHLEYWAEGVTIWFNAHWSEWNYPGTINTREKLAQYDDGLYRLVREYFTEDEIERCPPVES